MLRTKQLPNPNKTTNLQPQHCYQAHILSPPTSQNTNVPLQTIFFQIRELAKTSKNLEQFLNWRRKINCSTQHSRPVCRGPCLSCHFKIQLRETSTYDILHFTLFLEYMSKCHVWPLHPPQKRRDIYSYSCDSYSCYVEQWLQHPNPSLLVETQLHSAFAVFNATITVSFRTLLENFPNYLKNNPSESPTCIKIPHSSQHAFTHSSIHHW